MGTYPHELFVDQFRAHHSLAGMISFELFWGVSPLDSVPDFVDAECLALPSFVPVSEFPVRAYAVTWCFFV